MAEYFRSRDKAENFVKQYPDAVFLARIRHAGTEKWIVDYSRRDYGDAFVILEDLSHTIRALRTEPKVNYATAQASLSSASIGQSKSGENATSSSTARGSDKKTQARIRMHVARFLSADKTREFEKKSGADVTGWIFDDILMLLCRNGLDKDCGGNDVLRPHLVQALDELTSKGWIERCRDGWRAREEHLRELIDLGEGKGPSAPTGRPTGTASPTRPEAASSSAADHAQPKPAAPLSETKENLIIAASVAGAVLLLAVGYFVFMRSPAPSKKPTKETANVTVAKQETGKETTSVSAKADDRSVTANAPPRITPSSSETASPTNRSPLASDHTPAALQTASTIVIPGTTQGIWVNAIIGPGCNTTVPPEVHVLTAKQFSDLKQGGQLTSVGPPPILMSLAEPGEYWVGIQVKTDSVCARSFGGIASEDKVVSYFARDDCDGTAFHGGTCLKDSTGKLYIEFRFIKFYRAMVGPGKTTPVVGLFFPASMPIKDLATIYPQQTYFSIRSDKGLQVKADVADVELVTNLLRRGGKMPAGKETPAFYVDGDGMLTARVRTP